MGRGVAAIPSPQHVTALVSNYNSVATVVLDVCGRDPLASFWEAALAPLG
jgi:hypothetical protein